MTPSPPPPLPTPEEARELGMPEAMIADLMRAREAEQGIVKQIADALRGRREPHVIKTNPRAFERREGAPGTRSRIKRTKPSQGRSRGRETWIKKAKQKHKTERAGHATG